jgi:glutamate-1-semialdehyde 2,1-aminomutase
MADRKLDRSRAVFAEAQRYLPGGVNSPVRSFRGVGGDPVIVASGAGSRITDVDGNSYIDYCGSWGPLILGHAYPAVVEAVRAATGRGTSYGIATEGEVELAKLVCDSVPSIEMVRFVSSGTEATMSALRVARGFTGRSKVLKFDGCYHGHADGMLVQAGSGVATLSLPDSAGVPASYANETLVCPFNAIDEVEALFRQRGDELAAVIIEPVAANMGVVPPAAGFLERLRELCTAAGALLIFDEVITGFRVGAGSYQALAGVMPDLTCLGKVVGGGLPVGAYGGRRDVMELVAPLGPVYQAGTLSGNPLAVAAGIATLTAVRAPGFFEALEAKASRFAAGLEGAAAAAEVSIRLNRVGSLMTAFFTGEAVTDYTTARKSDTQRFRRFFHALLDAGVYFPPSQFEAVFVSAVHTDADLDATIEAASAAFAAAR